MIKWFKGEIEADGKNLDIRFHLEKGLVKKKSVIVNILTILAYLLQFASPIIWYAQATKKKSKFLNHTSFPMWLTEGWVLFKFSTLMGCLSLFSFLNEMRNSFWIYLLLLPCWFLLDNLTALSRDLILAPNIHKNKIYVYDFQRWMILTLMGAFEIILCFAVIISATAGYFENIGDNLFVSSLYLSTVTFCTLGYGDIHPKNCEVLGQIIILAELFYFIVSILVKIPIAVSMFKAEPVYQDHNSGNDGNSSSN